MAEPVFMKLDIYIMAHEPISVAYFISPSHQSVCLYVYPLSLHRQPLSRNVIAATNTCDNRIIVGRIVFYAVCVVSMKEGD
jgi:hypothetical protein